MCVPERARARARALPHPHHLTPSLDTFAPGPFPREMEGRLFASSSSSPPFFAQEGSGVALATSGLRVGRDDESSADSFWASLHESSLFANDFLLLGGGAAQHALPRGGGGSGVGHRAAHEAARLALPSSSSPLHRREVFKFTPHERHLAEAAAASESEEGLLSSIALDGIVDDEEVITTVQANSSDGSGQSVDEDEHARGASPRSAASPLEEQRPGDEVELRVEVGHLLADLLALSASAGESSFSKLLAKRVELLRRSQEACARLRRQKQKQQQHRISKQYGQPSTARSAFFGAVRQSWLMK